MIRMGKIDDLSKSVGKLVSTVHDTIDDNKRLETQNKRLNTKLQKITDSLELIDDPEIREEFRDILNGIEYPERNKGI